MPYRFPSGTELYKRYPVKKFGDAEIVLFEIKEELALIEMYKHGSMAYTPGGMYVKLMVKNTLWMSSTRMEYLTNMPFMDNAIGNVFIGGLGLGLVVHELMDKPWIEHITVVEVHPDVVTLVKPTVNKKVTVICQDVFDYRPPEGTLYDTIYFDIWDNMNVQGTDIRRLHNIYKKYKEPAAGTMGSWGQTPLPVEWRERRGLKRRKAVV